MERYASISTWVEPSILWFIVAAKKGEKKTAAVRTIRRPLEEIQREMENWEVDISDEKPKSPPQILVDNFSCEELHCVMKRNGNQVLGCLPNIHHFMRSWTCSNTQVSTLTTNTAQ